MTYPISPGVYPREIDQSFIAPAVANSIGAIVIHSDKGPTDAPQLITNNKQFLDTYGSLQPDEPSMYAALAFLERGKRLYVLRVINNATVATKAIVDALAATVFTINAANAGAWGNNIKVSVTVPGADGSFIVTVKDGTTTVETFSVSRSTTKKDGFGRSMYIEDVINNQSSYIRVDDTTAVGPHVAVTDVALTGGADDTIAPTDAQVNTGWDMFAVKEDIEISLLINGGWDTTTVQTKMITLAETRKDCFAILDVPDTETTVANMVTYVSTTLNQNSSFAAIYAGWPYIYDQYNDKYLYVPPSGYVAAVYANTADVSEVWYAPAGVRRGVLRVLGVSKVFSEGERDTLYSARINPIQNFVGEGIQVYGQKTLQSSASALDRVNVRMLMIDLEKAISRSLRPFVFEFNDQFTRENITSVISTYMDNIKSRRGVYDYLCVCDDTNNTAAVIDQNKLIVDLYVKPVRVAEFIQLNAIITASGVNFTNS
jgi:hypothetical protein